MVAVTEIRPGFASRRPTGTDSDGYRLVQGRDLNSDGAVDWSSLDRCPSNRGAERATLADGDVLLFVRTTAPRAIRIHEPPPMVCASSQFAILRPRRQILDPDYLCWSLNSAATLARLRASYRGSAMPFLSLVDLANFEIDVPDLARQRRIARIHRMRQQLATLQRRHDQALDLLLTAASRGGSA